MERRATIRGSADRRRRIAAGAAFGVVRTATGVEETNVEVYGSWQLNTWTFVSPHVQVVHNEQWLKDTTTILGMRVQFNF